MYFAAKNHWQPGPLRKDPNKWFRSDRIVRTAPLNRLARPNDLGRYFLVVFAACLVGPIGLKETRAQDKYCGIYSVYGAARLLGTDVEFSSLINSRFVSTVLGSTTEDLEKAIRSLGLNCRSFSNLGYRSLIATSDPLILHVCSDQQFVSYNHWLLFIGMDGDIARISESGEGVKYVPIGELLARWDGVAIVVFRDSASADAIAYGKKSEVFQWAALCSLIVALLVNVKRPVRCLFALAAGMLLVLHVATPLGFCRSEDVLSKVETVIGSTGIRRVDFASVQRLVRSEAITLLDVRYRMDTERGMIPGAISLPIDAMQTEFDQTVKSIARDGTVVVYCQSSECPYSQVMAIRLLGAGFTDIRIYSGGYREWLTKQSEGGTDETTR
jgi:rhodanese-related sulfurtransferase